MFHSEIVFVGRGLTCERETFDWLRTHTDPDVQALFDPYMSLVAGLEGSIMATIVVTHRAEERTWHQLGVATEDHDYIVHHSEPLNPEQRLQKHFAQALNLKKET